MRRDHAGSKKGPSNWGPLALQNMIETLSASLVRIGQFNNPAGTAAAQSRGSRRKRPRSQWHWWRLKIGPSGEN